MKAFRCFSIALSALWFIKDTPPRRASFAASWGAAAMNLMPTARDVEIYSGLSVNVEDVLNSVKVAETEWRKLFEVRKGPQGEKDFGKLFQSQKLSFNN